MSELKVYVKPLKTNILGQTIVGQSYYLKSEADKVIAEKDAEIAKLKEALKNAGELNQERKRYETATFYRMISESEYSSGYGTNGENCIEDFASNITFRHTQNKYWKLVKSGKTIAREAIYLGE